MNKKFLSTKLEIKLIIALVFSFIISVCIFLLIYTAGENILDNYFNKTSFLVNQKKQAVSEFKEYVSDNSLSINDHDKIESWIRQNKNVNLYIYKDNDLVYASNINDEVTSYEQYKESPIFPSNTLVDVSFIDSDAKMHMECFFEYKYYYFLAFAGIAISLLFFIILILFFINKKITYIGLLETEIKILEGGDLTYDITIDSNDELSSLAQSINDMRKSFIERLENESEAQLANSELITALSHDLRTPLTALVGYLDIIEYKKYKTEENFKQYIHNSREKAYQIKYLSDKLFEYFTVFNTCDALELETFNGNELLEQLIQEQIFLLDNKGFFFDFSSCNTPFLLEVNLISMQRVFDNIFSNLSKYADKSKVIKVNYYIEKEKLFITVENQINNLKALDSTGIGLKTCKKIIEMHKGEFDIKRRENLFLISITLNITSS
ncbi:signal transduction histidine kinase [Clostridium saccharoperbutylacetonicum]|uniref:histidine kinase n=1 Tax=Clostridium saccharoperbutylacetonicum N1-4(HMT) TaxID=931276 RepID=M1MVK3_9CLOT|nr:HAMP domain-containing sensor histidine kinase [Clostridium saccharoperbutylacetonicum]AGF55547.1 signal transduction histidine kinase [Clostridium saccharoperbutylacetonicum N1-4(HMT)]NRT63734.1 signal transduction histidine kinase [Clostridium saccharoperbutylacetonicum]NSB27097.1 signal transduction histidine kinase [Clostridium saccharoperbutylacetonicum]NSB40582.1 signal transduction histidine kinase [Clostridium saccharoperbutylacetonicum]